MRKINFGRVFTAVGLAALVIVYSILWLRMIGSRAERTGADFIGFYTAGWIARTDGSGQIYIPEVQQKIEQQVVGFDLAPGQVLLFNHLPYFVPLLSLIVNGNYVTAFMRWTVILLLVILIDTGVLIFTLRKSGLDRGRLLLLGAGTILFFPMFTSLMNGQDTVFLLLAGAIWLCGILFDQDILAGLGLSLITIRPQLALILALPFLFKKRKVFAWFLAGASLLGLYVLLYLGLDGTRNFLHILAISASGDWYGLHPADMPTLTGMLYRLLPGLGGNTIQISGMAAYLLAMAGLCLFWVKSEKIGSKQIGIAVIVGIFFIPYLHYHDLSLLLIPIYCLGLAVLPARRSLIAVLPLAISFFLLSGFFWAPITYVAVFLVMIVLVYFLWNPGWVGKRRRPAA